MSGAMSARISTFCKAREAHLTARAERTEMGKEEKIHAKELTDGMQEVNLTCIAMEDGFLRLVPGAKRTLPLRSVEDVLSLTADLERHISSVPREDVPVHVMKLVKQRAVERGPPPGPPRLITSSYAQRNQKATLVSTLPTKMQDMAHAYCSAKAARSKHTDLVNDLRKEEMEAEGKMMGVLPREGIVVQMKNQDYAWKIRPPEASTSSTSSASGLPPPQSATSVPPASSSSEQPPAPTPTASHTPSDTPRSPPRSPPLPSSPCPPPSSPPPLSLPAAEASGKGGRLGTRVVFPIIKKAAAEAIAISRSSSKSFDDELRRLLVLRLSSQAVPPPSSSSPASSKAIRKTRVNVRKVKALGKKMEAAKTNTEEGS